MPIALTERALGVSTMAVELARVPPAVVESTRSGDDMLDWVEYCVRFFPEHRRRHNFEALVAYGTYRRSAARSHPAGEKIPPVSAGAQLRPPVNGSNIVAPSAELSSWEGEGGKTLA